jgi:hypothetical protein
MILMMNIYYYDENKEEDTLYTYIIRVGLVKIYIYIHIIIIGLVRINCCIA